MKLQLALDVDKKKALSICKKVSKFIDIIELGTPLIKQEGLKAVKEFKKFRKPLVADLKTMDTGFHEAELAFKAEADITTVCGCADDETIKGSIKAAKKYKKECLVDLISSKNVVKRAKQVNKLKPNYICVHTAIDVQDKKDPFSNFKKVKKIVDCKVSVAGGITPKTISKVKDADIVIVGGAITKAKNPIKVCKELRERIK